MLQHTSPWPCLLLLVLAACGAGPYSFSRSYVPLGAEEPHYEATQQYVSFEDVQRDPNGFKDKELGWFGVVTGYSDLPDGRQRLALSLRAHQARHLCSDRSDDSCRVTVAERSLGSFVIEVKLRPEELVGRDRVWIGSLLKVYGNATGELDEDGAAILTVKHYRHFPRGTYVTTAQRGAMRR
jgi:hypothetical protein